MPYKGERRFNMRMPGELYTLLLTRAKEHERSLNGEIVYSLLLIAKLDEAERRAVEALLAYGD
jgi:predicted HicB family RNase H-like nuclease